MTKEKILSADQFIAKFFKSLGVTQPARPDEFWRNLKKKFGSAAAEFERTIDARERGETLDPYEIKNSSLPFAMAVASQYDMPRLRESAKWLVNHEIFLQGPTLEIGCDNGILLCMLASLYPEQTFIGIDINEHAILRAKENATRLSLNNINFEVATLSDEFSKIGTGKFKTIFSNTVFHEILPRSLNLANLDDMILDLKCFSLREEDEQIKSKITPCEPLRIIKIMLADEGRFISIDRWQSPVHSLFWIRTNEMAGMTLSIQASDIIRYKSIMSGQFESLPLTVFSKQNPSVAVASDDVLALHGYLNFSEIKELQEFEDGYVAEMLYEALDKVELYSQEAEYLNGSGTQHILVGIAGSVAYIYTTTSRGLRHLTLTPSISLNETLPSVIKAKERFEPFAKVSEHWHTSDALKRLGIRPTKT